VVIKLYKSGNATSDIAAERKFYFYTDVGVYTNRCVSDLKAFYDTLEDVDVKSIEFHMGRGDFEKWIKFLGDNTLARNVAKVGKKGINGEDLRVQLRNAVKKRLGR
jgi:hypothetical protein